MHNAQCAIKRAWKLEIGIWDLEIENLGDLRGAALAIFRAGLAAADPRLAIRRALHREGHRLIVEGRIYDLASIDRVFVIGFGKAGAAMAQAVEEIVGDRVERGWVNVKYGHLLPPENALRESAGSATGSTSELPTRKIHLHEAGHPLPDANSALGASKILELLDGTRENDLVICLISGGGSALLELPVEGVSLDDMRVMTDALLRSGATINELNSLRKHLSQVKGGQLARRTRARVLSLILSDVIGSPLVQRQPHSKAIGSQQGSNTSVSADTFPTSSSSWKSRDLSSEAALDTIASGPTVADSTTFADALNVIEQRGIRSQIPASILAHLERGVRGEIADTPKLFNDPLFARVQNVVVADNALACQTALEAARARGLNPLLLTTYLQGEAREVARVLVAIAREVIASNQPVAVPACILAGGETTVTVRGKGKGGRNQELALAAAIELEGMPAERAVVLSAGTDGTDGPTDAAGALTDGATVSRAAALGLDARKFLANNDAYHLFEPLHDLVLTGPTNTNVNDLVLILMQ